MPISPISIPLRPIYPTSSSLISICNNAQPITQTALQSLSKRSSPPFSLPSLATSAIGYLKSNTRALLLALSVLIALVVVIKKRFSIPKVIYPETTPPSQILTPPPQEAASQETEAEKMEILEVPQLSEQPPLSSIPLIPKPPSELAPQKTEAEKAEERDLDLISVVLNFSFGTDVTKSNWKEFLNKIPRKQRWGFATKITQLSISLDDKNDLIGAKRNKIIQLIYDTLLKLPGDEYLDYITCLGHAPKYIVEIHEILLALPQSVRRPFILFLSKTFSSPYNEIKLKDFLQILKKIPHDAMGWHQFCALIERVWEMDLLSSLLMFCNRLENLLEFRIALSIPLIMNNSPFSNNLLKLLLESPDLCTQEFADNINKLASQFDWKERVGVLLNALEDVSIANRLTHFKSTVQTTLDEKDLKKLARHHWLLAWFPFSRMKSDLPNWQFLETIDFPIGFKSHLDAIPVSYRPAFIDIANTFIHQIPKEKVFKGLLAITRVSEQKWEEFKKYLIFFKEIPEAAIQIAKIPSAYWKDCHKMMTTDVAELTTWKWAAPLLNGIENKFERLKIFKVLTNIAPAQQEAFCRCAQYVSRHYPATHKYLLYRALSKLDFMRLEHVLPFLVIQPLEVTALIQSLDLIDLFPKKDQTPILNAIRLNFHKNYILTKNLYTLLAPELRIQFHSNPHFKLDTFLSEGENSKINNAYLTSFLKNTNNDPKQLHSVATLIVANFQKLLLYQDHPLYLLACITHSVTTPEARAGFANSLHLLRRMQMMQKEDKPLNLTVRSFYEKRTVEISTETLRKLSPPPFTSDDLPAGITFKGLMDLFENLEKRIQQLPDPAAAQQSIKNGYEKTLSELRANLCGKDFVQDALIARPPNTLIENRVFYLYAILRMVFEQSTEIPAAELLSPRECALLSMSASIANCTTGQRQGTELYYFERVPSTYRHPTKEPGGDYEVAVNRVLGRTVEAALCTTFMKEKLVADLIFQQTGLKITSVAEAAQQTEFLKNFFFWHVGRYSPQYDINTRVVYKKLLNLTPENFFSTFFAHFSVKDLISRVKQDFAEELKASPHDLNASILFCLKPLCEAELEVDTKSMKDLPVDPLTNTITTRFFVCNEDYIPIGITDETAFLLLMHRKVLVACK